MRLPWPCLVVALVSFPLPAAEKIYRCIENDRAVFTDQACENGQVYRELRRPESTDSPARLERLMEDNRRFVEMRRERLARARLERARAHPDQPAIIFVHPHRSRLITGIGHARKHGAKPRRQAADPDVGEERFSALSGPFPGTRPASSRPAPASPPARGALRPRGAPRGRNR